MMPYFTSVSRIYGVDPMERSAQLCADLRVPGSFARCESIPKNVPFGSVEFDIVYSFSVFTHLSPAAARAVLSVVRERIAPKGLLILTIRPLEFWEVVAPRFGEAAVKQAEHAHRRNQIAFIPVEDPLYAVDGQPTFGDTSMSMAALQGLAAETGWVVSPDYERSLVDPYQLIVVLKPS